MTGSLVLLIDCSALTYQSRDSNTDHGDHSEAPKLSSEAGDLSRHDVHGLKLNREFQHNTEVAVVRVDLALDSKTHKQASDIKGRSTNTENGLRVWLPQPKSFRNDDPARRKPGEFHCVHNSAGRDRIRFMFPQLTRGSKPSRSMPGLGGRP